MTLKDKFRCQVSETISLHGLGLTDCTYVEIQQSEPQKWTLDIRAAGLEGGSNSVETIRGASVKDIWARVSPYFLPQMADTALPQLRSFLNLPVWTEAEKHPRVLAEESRKRDEAAAMGDTLAYKMVS